MTNEQAVQLAKSQFIRLSDGAIKTAILSSPFAWLETPPLNLITNKAIDWIINKIADNAEIGIFFLYINFNTTKEGADFMKAALANDIAQKTGSLDEKIKAENNLKDSFSRLIVISK